jgi:hypothetical protein
MGYYQDLLNQIMEVERQGFNPYTESYSGRIGQLSVPNGTTTPTPTESVLEQPISTPEQPLNITQSFVKAGYDDPFDKFVTESGVVDYSKLSSVYNQALQDPKIGVSGQQVIDYVNRAYPRELGKTYYEGAQIIANPQGGLEVSEQEAVIDDDGKSRFEKTYDAQQKKDLFFEFDEITGKKKRTFETQEEYDKARKEYKDKQVGQ